jgi:hypothetical protein
MLRTVFWSIVAVLLFSPAALAQDEQKPLYKTTYRVVNVHRHCDTASEVALKAELEAMDKVGASVVVVLDGGQSDNKLPAWMELQKKALLQSVWVTFSGFRLPGACR